MAALRGESRHTRAQVAVVVAFATLIEYVFAGWLGVYEYRLGNVAGVLGVLGPTRMPYEKVAAIVEHASRLLGELTAPITTKDITLH